MNAYHTGMRTCAYFEVKVSGNASYAFQLLPNFLKSASNLSGVAFGKRKGYGANLRVLLLS